MRNILIIGAGEAGRIILGRLLKIKNVRVAGFLDDNPALRGKIIQGAPVIGSLSGLDEAVRKYDVAEIIVAIPSADGEALTPIIQKIISLNLPYKIAPGFYNFETSEVDIRYPLRKIDITDLLGRHTVDLPIKLVSRYIKGKKILITGAGGSIGSEICRTLAMFHPGRLILFGRGEGSIFAIQEEMKLRFADIKTESVIASCNDRAAVFEHFHRICPDIVFHAAAHKHVPFMENDPKEAFKNNVLGSMNIFDACVSSRADRVITLSTDKAVRPKSVMGISKRIVECLIQNDYRSAKTLFSAVRFGNVLGSRGSVVEIFQKQIDAGGPLTLTHRNVTRYFMTIPEAAQLVIMAGSIASPGAVYILNMGKQIPIMKIAKELIRLNGLAPDRDIKITITGLRQGEKLRESLLIQPGHRKTIHKKIWVETPAEKHDSNLRNNIMEISGRIKGLTHEEVMKCMKKLIF